MAVFTLPDGTAEGGEGRNDQAYPHHDFERGVKQPPDEKSRRRTGAVDHQLYLAPVLDLLGIALGADVYGIHTFELKIIDWGVYRGGGTC